MPTPPSRNSSSASLSPKPRSASRDLPRPKPAPQASLPLPAPPPFPAQPASASQLHSYSDRPAPPASAVPRPATAPSARRAARRPLAGIVFGVYEPRGEHVRAVPAVEHVAAAVQPTAPRQPPSRKPVPPLPAAYTLAAPSAKPAAPPPRPPRPPRPLSITTTTSLASTHHRLVNRGNALARLEGRAPVTAMAGSMPTGRGLLPFGPVSSQKTKAQSQPQPMGPVGPTGFARASRPAFAARPPPAYEILPPSDPHKHGPGAVPHSAGYVTGAPWKEAPLGTKSFMPFSTFEDSDEEDSDSGDGNSETEESAREVPAGDIKAAAEAQGDGDAQGDANEVRVEVELVSAVTSLQTKVEKIALDPLLLRPLDAPRAREGKKTRSRPRSGSTPSKRSPSRSKSSTPSRRGTIASWYAGPDASDIPPVPGTFTGNFMDFGDDIRDGEDVASDGALDAAAAAAAAPAAGLDGEDGDAYVDGTTNAPAFDVEEHMVFRDGEDTESDSDGSYNMYAVGGRIALGGGFRGVYGLELNLDLGSGMGLDKMFGIRSG